MMMMNDDSWITGFLKLVASILFVVPTYVTFLPFPSRSKITRISVDDAIVFFAKLQRNKALGLALAHNTEIQHQTSFHAYL